MNRFSLSRFNNMEMLYDIKKNVFVGRRARELLR